jgi:hypothetical protein
MFDPSLQETISLITTFYDSLKVGYEGSEGYRKSTNLAKLSKCVRELASLGLIQLHRTVFVDLGCADGRVNVLMSYVAGKSIGIEIDADILSEFSPRKKTLLAELKKRKLMLPPDNIALFQGSSLAPSTYQHMVSEIGIHLKDVDLFYTYITLHDLFAEKIAKEAKDGALYLVYGFNKVLPRYQGLSLLIPDVASQEIAALYVKEATPIETVPDGNCFA